jgi:hypothetical protein
MDAKLAIAIINFRKEIAKLEVEQKKAKSQRKTVHFTGTRTMEPWEATEFVQDTKVELRAMYAAYGLLRGKKFEQIESNSKPINRNEIYERTGMYVSEKFEGLHPLTLYRNLINKYLNKYGYEMPYEEKKDAWGKPYKDVIPESCEKIVCFDKQTA